MKEAECSQIVSLARQGCTHPLYSTERHLCLSWLRNVRAQSRYIPSPACCFLWFPAPTEDNGFCCSCCPWEAGVWQYTPNTSVLFFCLGFYFTVEVGVLALFCSWDFSNCFLPSSMLHSFDIGLLLTSCSQCLHPLFFSTTLPRHRLKGCFLPCMRLPMPIECT